MPCLTVNSLEALTSLTTYREKHSAIPGSDASLSSVSSCFASAIYQAKHALLNQMFLCWLQHVVCLRATWNSGESNYRVFQKDPDNFSC